MALLCFLQVIPPLDLKQACKSLRSMVAYREGIGIFKHSEGIEVQGLAISTRDTTEARARYDAPSQRSAHLFGAGRTAVQWPAQLSARPAPLRRSPGSQKL